jgi:hypothetical protein
MTKLIDNIFDSLADNKAMELSRNITKSNQGMYAHYNVLTSEIFLPNVLVYLGLFPSNSQVKKNRLDLWRDTKDNEVIQIGKVILRIYKTAQPIWPFHEEVIVHGVGGVDVNS